MAKRKPKNGRLQLQRDLIAEIVRLGQNQDEKLREIQDLYTQLAEIQKIREHFKLSREYAIEQLRRLLEAYHRGD